MLHNRMMVGADGTLDKLIEAAIEDLLRLLASRYRNADPHTDRDGIISSLLAFLESPTLFDAAGAVSLRNLLARVANQYVHNQFRAERRRQRRQAIFLEISVELADSAEHYPMECTIVVHKARQVLTDPMDRQLLDLWLEGEKRTGEYARILDLAHLPLAAQCLKVKRAKDRIFKQLRRKLGRQGLSRQGVEK